MGLNGRLDTLQAAILIEKLKIFKDELDRRDLVAARYREGLGLEGKVKLPCISSRATSAWAQYTIRVTNRDGLVEHLKSAGIPVAIYYPKPLHRQTAYLSCPRAADQLENADRLSGEVLSLPMHPYLQPDQQDYIIESILEGL